MLFGDFGDDKSTKGPGKDIPRSMDHLLFALGLERIRSNHDYHEGSLDDLEGNPDSDARFHEVNNNPNGNDDNLSQVPEKVSLAQLIDCHLNAESVEENISLNELLQIRRLCVSLYRYCV